MNATNAPVIRAEALTKAYDGRKSVSVTAHKALEGLTLEVQPGEIFGYLGPNGAGKTTTIKLLLDLIRPTSGHATIFGQDVNTHAVTLHKRIGYLPGELNLWSDQTAREVVRFIGNVRGDKGDKQHYAESLIARLNLDPTKKLRSYSTGNKRKVGLVLALMSKPDLLILDEPTSGLDPLMQVTFHEMLREAQKNGQTVFLSSHVLSEVQQVCDRVGILRNGKLQTVDRVDALTHVTFRHIMLRFRDVPQLDALETLSGVSKLTRDDHDAHMIRLELQGDFDPLLRALGNQYITEIHSEDPSLEDIFLSYYRGN